MAQLLRLRKQCFVVPVGEYLVMFGGMIATEGNVLVMRSNDVRDGCHFCTYSTQYRLIDAVRVGGRRFVRYVYSCCRTCQAAIAKLPADATHEDMVKACLSGAVRDNEPQRRGERETLFQQLIDQALDALAKEHKLRLQEAAASGIVYATGPPIGRTGAEVAADAALMAGDTQYAAIEAMLAGS